jgi:hypothetical protein
VDHALRLARDEHHVQRGNDEVGRLLLADRLAEHRARHLRLDQSGQHRVDAHAGAAEGLAAHRVRLFTAALLAMDEIAPALARSDAADDVRMIEPLPYAVITRPAYFTARKQLRENS